MYPEVVVKAFSGLVCILVVLYGTEGFIFEDDGRSGFCPTDGNIHRTRSSKNWLESSCDVGRHRWASIPYNRESREACQRRNEAETRIKPSREIDQARRNRMEIFRSFDTPEKSISEVNRMWNDRRDISRNGRRIGNQYTTSISSGTTRSYENKLVRSNESGAMKLDPARKIRFAMERNSIRSSTTNQKRAVLTRDDRSLRSIKEREHVIRIYETRATRSDEPSQMRSVRNEEVKSISGKRTDEERAARSNERRLTTESRSRNSVENLRNFFHNRAVRFNENPDYFRSVRSSENRATRSNEGLMTRKMESRSPNSIENGERSSDNRLRRSSENRYSRSESILAERSNEIRETRTKRATRSNEGLIARKMESRSPNSIANGERSSDNRVRRSSENRSSRSESILAERSNEIRATRTTRATRSNERLITRKMESYQRNSIEKRERSSDNRVRRSGENHASRSKNILAERSNENRATRASRSSERLITRKVDSHQPNSIENRERFSDNRVGRSTENRASRSENILAEKSNEIRATRATRATISNERLITRKMESHPRNSIENLERFADNRVRRSSENRASRSENILTERSNQIRATRSNERLITRKMESHSRNSIDNRVRLSDNRVRRSIENRALRSENILAERSNENRDIRATRTNERLTTRKMESHPQRSIENRERFSDYRVRGPSENRDSRSDNIRAARSNENRVIRLDNRNKRSLDIGVSRSEIRTNENRAARTIENRGVRTIESYSPNSIENRVNRSNRNRVSRSRNILTLRSNEKQVPRSINRHHALTSEDFRQMREIDRSTNSRSVDSQLTRSEIRSVENRSARFNERRTMGSMEGHSPNSIGNRERSFDNRLAKSSEHHAFRLGNIRGSPNIRTDVSGVTERSIFNRYIPNVRASIKITKRQLENSFVRKNYFFVKSEGHRRSVERLLQFGNDRRQRQNSKIWGRLVNENNRLKEDMTSQRSSILTSPKRNFKGMREKSRHLRNIRVETRTLNRNEDRQITRFTTPRISNHMELDKDQTVHGRNTRMDKNVHHSRKITGQRRDIREASYRMDSLLTPTVGYKELTFNMRKKTEYLDPRTQSTPLKATQDVDSSWYGMIQVTVATILIGQIVFSVGENSKRSFFANGLRKLQCL